MTRDDEDMPGGVITPERWSLLTNDQRAEIWDAWTLDQRAQFKQIHLQYEAAERMRDRHQQVGAEVGWLFSQVMWYLGVGALIFWGLLVLILLATW